MALYQYVTYEEPDIDKNGKPFVWIRYTDELEETPCARCGNEAFPNVCPADGRYHHHGCVHTPDQELEPLCRLCVHDVAREFADRKQMADEVRATIESL